MAKLCSLLYLVFLLGLGGCTRIHVKAQYDKNTDFSRYQTFSFSPMRPPEETTIAFSQINQERLNRAITRELESRHYRRVEGDADLKVSNYLSVENKQKVGSRAGPPPSHYSGYYGNYYGYYHGGYQTVEYKVGTLVIDLVDTKGNRLVWEGIGIGTMMHKPKDPEEKINRAVEKIFFKYPGKASAVSK